MTCWHPHPRILLGLVLALATPAALAAPAAALPLVGIGANVGASAHYASHYGLAYDLNADLALMGPTVGLQYWSPVGGGANYLQAGVRYNASPIPMINVSPGVAAAMVNGGWGGLVTLNASFNPLMMPFSIEGMAGAGWANSGLLLPYNVGVKLSLIPFTAIKAGWRGWSGALDTSGPEIGLEIGL